MNIIEQWLHENQRSKTWLAKRIGMSGQTLGNKIRGLSDEQLLETFSLAEWYQLREVTGLFCPICNNQTNEE